jgi:hypothetical protein
MKEVTISFAGVEVFEDSQIEAIAKECTDSVEFMVADLFKGAMATIDLSDGKLYLNIHDADMSNDLGTVPVDDIFNSYTDSSKLVTPESMKRAVTLRDKLEEMRKDIDKAVKGAKTSD